MAITTRQTSLLVQQDWTKLYQTFREADFQSYDYETLRKAMIDYLRTYYPEDFNDFTESSEYVALIDLLAFLGQSLAFRTDLNARENFIDTAERRDSILKLARLVSYNPKRNIPANGYLKISSLSTTEVIVDSNGRNLSNLVVDWNDATNDNWLEQFTAIINAALVNTQVVGKPGASKVINGIQTDEYGLSVVNSVMPIFRFSSVVEGNTMSFEAVSASSLNQNYIYEKDPKPTGLFNILYKNDNQGNGSNNTGFFLYFKQGEMRTLDFTLNESLPNRVVNINFDNINNDDVWLYPISNSGTPGTKWSKVVAVGGINVVYNQESDRNLYQVNTRADDQVDLVFGDGAFANVPQGNFRLYYRQSNGLTYKITPDEMQNIQISINYISRTNRLETLTFTASLHYTINNASAKEGIEDIRQKAPQQYYTQNRMVTGEDYNILPYTTFNNVLKVKSVNRSSSGVSRYLDVIDTTGKYSSTNIFSEDGLLYRDITDTNTEFSYSTSNDVYKIIYNVAKPMIASKEAMHLYHYGISIRADQSLNAPALALYFQETQNSIGKSTGLFVDGANRVKSLGTAAASDNLEYIRTGSLLRFEPPSGKYFDKNNAMRTGTPTLSTDKLVIYATVDSAPTSASVVLSQNVPSGAVLKKVTPVFNNDWSTTLVNQIANLILSNKNFGLVYNTSTMSWAVIDDTVLPARDQLSNTEFNFDDDSNRWFLAFTYYKGKYTITQRKLYYYFESKKETRFYFDPKVKVYDSSNGTVLRDHIKVLKTNTQPDSNNPLEQDQIWYVYDRIIQPDGYQDTKRILITFPDSNNDNIPDDPTLFDVLVSPTVDPLNKQVYLKQVSGYNSFLETEVVDSVNVSVAYTSKADAARNIGLFDPGQIFYCSGELDTETLRTGVFYVSNSTASALVKSNDYILKTGREGLYFQYRHNSPGNRRVDPSPNNIMDLYILTRSYNTLYGAWIKDSSGRIDEPVAPTTEELRTEFQQLENLKSLSDTIVYNSVKFKPIFGAKATSTLQATFKVVKNPNLAISDNEIKSQVISAINTYFDIANWDFGETFYFSELSAYLHTKLVPNVSSIIIVPSASGVAFGGLYQINAEANEIITSCATVDNVEIISAITAAQLNQTLAGLNSV